MPEPDEKSSTPVLDEPPPTPVKVPPPLRPEPRSHVKRRPALPPLWKHLVLLCLKPEQWSQAARYPLLYILLTVAVAIALVSLATGLVAGRQAVTMAHEFVETYDQRHPALVYKDGKLALADASGATQPGASSRLPRFLWRELTIVIDPTDKTTVDSFPTAKALVIGSSTVSLRAGGPADTYQRPLTWLVDGCAFLVPDKSNFRIDGANLQRMLSEKQMLLAIWIATVTAMARVLSDSLWVFASAFLVHSLVILGAPNLVMPRRVAYRIAFALLVPLIILGGVMDVAGIGPAAIVGPENALIIWFFAAAGLAFWAGILTERRFRPRATH